MKEYASPLVVKLTPSNHLRYFFLLIHLLALTAVDYAMLGLFIKLCCFIMIAISYSYSLRQINRFSQFTWADNNQWSLVNKSNEQLEAQLTPMSFFINHLLVLVLRLENGKNASLLITRDAVNEDVFRRLKVKLTMIKPSYFSSADDEMKDTGDKKAM